MEPAQPVHFREVETWKIFSGASVNAHDSYGRKA